MKRSRFINILGGLVPLAALGWVVDPKPGLKRVHHPFPKGSWKGSSGPNAIADLIEHYSGGIRPLAAHVQPLARTGDAMKFAIGARHPNGAWFTKTIIFGGCFLAVHGSTPGARAGEKAYQIQKRSKELARDWAYLKWGDDWRRHVPWPGTTRGTSS